MPFSDGVLVVVQTLGRWMSVSRFDAGKGMFFVGRLWECFDDCLYVVALAFFFWCVCVYGQTSQISTPWLPLRVLTSGEIL